MRKLPPTAQPTVTTLAATCCLALAITLPASADWSNWLDKARNTVTGNKQGDATTATAMLSNSEVVNGLKQALVQGSKTAINKLGQEDGFLGDPQVRIPIPEKLETLEKGLRALGQGAMADNFITSMNRAAEQAVPQATDLFVNTISEMSLEDARGILKGADNAATQYLQQKNGDQLQALMKPIVEQATQSVGVTSAYKSMFDKAGFLGRTVNMDSLDLDSYVTEQATNGLFLLIAAEEKRIRENPVARTTDLLKKVFSGAR